MSDFQSQVDEIAGRDPHAKKNGDGWIISCPCHDDDSPSLSITATEKDILVHCFAGCDWEKVKQALGIKRKKWDRSAYVVAVYQHPDGRTRPRYREDHNGPCWRKDCTKTGKHKHIWGEKGRSSKGCYLLTWGKDDRSKTLVLVEGEKAARALLTHCEGKRYTPVTWNGGANVTDALFDVVKGRRVILWPDNDEAGQEAMMAAGHNAADAGAIEVRLMDNVGDLPTKGDAADIDAADAMRRLSETESQHVAMDADGKMRDWGNVPRPGPGRPRSDNPSEKTLSNRKSQERVDMMNYAFENSFASPLCFDRPIENDVDRILTYHNDKLLAVDSILHIANGGVWRRLSTNDVRGMTALANLLIDARRAAVHSLPSETPTTYGVHIYELRTTAWYIKQVADTLRTRVDQVKGIPRQAFDDRNRYPLIPFTDGNCIDLAANKWIGPAEALPCYIADHGWEIPAVAVDKTHEATKEIIERQYGDELLNRVALYLTGTDKTCDVARFPSNAGKTTFYDLLSKAFPGAFAKRNASDVVQTNHTRFTPLSEPLSQSVGVFLDEATHAEAEIKASQMNAWDSEELELERKYENRITVRRIGNVMLLGAEEWPHVNASAQGYASRFRWAIDRIDVGEMSTQEWYTLRDDDAVNWFRSHIIMRAVSLLTKHGTAWQARQAQEKDPLILASLHDLAEARIDPIAAALVALLEDTSDLRDHITPDEIIDTLKASGDVNPRSIPTKHVITKMMQTAFNNPNLKLSRVTGSDGKRVRAYQGFKKTA